MATRVSNIGAAVIGSGFIGTVHIEALRRIGVQVKGVLGSSAERSSEQASRLGLPRGYASLEELLEDDAWTWSTSRRQTGRTSRRCARS